MKDGSRGRAPMPAVTPSNAFVESGDSEDDNGSDAGSLGGRSEDDASEFDDDEFEYELDEELERNTEVCFPLSSSHSDVEANPPMSLTRQSTGERVRRHAV